jgi:hypothetical protein
MHIFLETQSKRNTCMSIHSYEYMHIHSTPISTFERTNRLDLGIHEVDHQERLTIDGKNN